MMVLSAAFLNGLRFPSSARFFTMWLWDPKDVSFYDLLGIDDAKKWLKAAVLTTSFLFLIAWALQFILQAIHALGWMQAEHLSAAGPYFRFFSAVIPVALCALRSAHYFYRFYESCVEPSSGNKPHEHWLYFLFRGVTLFVATLVLGTLLFYKTWIETQYPAASVMLTFLVREINAIPVFLKFGLELRAGFQTGDLSLSHVFNRELSLKWVFFALRLVASVSVSVCYCVTALQPVAFGILCGLFAFNLIEKPFLTGWSKMRQQKTALTVEPVPVLNQREKKKGVANKNHPEFAVERAAVVTPLYQERKDGANKENALKHNQNKKIVLGGKKSSSTELNRANRAKKKTQKNQFKK